MNRVHLAAIGAVLALTIAGCSEPERNGGVLAGGAYDANAMRTATDAARSSVVRIEVTGCDSSGSGTGFHTGGGRIVTNRHVVEGAVSVEVVADNGATRDATGWRVSRTADVAELMVTPAATDRPLKFADIVPTPGDRVAVVGYPLGGPLTISEGRIIPAAVSSRIASAEESSELTSAGPLIGATTEVLPGNSGGPLLDAQGHAVGLIFAFARRDSTALAMNSRTTQEALANAAALAPEAC